MVDRLSKLTLIYNLDIYHIL